jgi:hypothetical protein
MPTSVLKLAEVVLFLTSAHAAGALAISFQRSPEDTQTMNGIEKGLSHHSKNRP